ncbi:unnamed protein product [Sphagnum tenellum]
MSVEVATGGAVPSPEVANEVTIHQGLGVDEKHQETRTARMAISDAILVGEAEKGAQNTDGVLTSAVEGMNEQLKERLDNVEGLEVKCLTEEDPGILEEEKSPKLGLFLNTLANSEGPLSLTDDVVDVGEELVAYNMVSKRNLDMSEDDRVVIHMLPEISTEPAAMGVSSYSNNVMRGEHQADHGYLGLGSSGGTEVVQRPRENILHKQELDGDKPADEEGHEDFVVNLVTKMDGDEKAKENETSYMEVLGEDTALRAKSTEDSESMTKEKVGGGLHSNF